MIHNRFKFVSLLGLFASVALSPSVASAQSALDEIVVTATKREESSQNIPLSIEIVSGEYMENLGITDFTELQSTIPNLNVAYGITTQVIAIRGLGSGQERSFEQSVGMFIDGFYMPRSRQYQSPFFDVSQVEVVRGPQSAIHGLNSTAGAISIVTNKAMPGDPFTLDLTADAEMEFGGGSISAIAGGSLSDSFAIRAAVKVGQRDGYYENSFTGTDEGDVDDTLARITAVWTPSDRSTISLKYETAERDMDGNTGEVFSDGRAIFAAADAAEPTDGVLNWTRSSNGCQTDSSGFPNSMTVAGTFPHTCPRQTTQLDTILLNVDYEFENSTLSFMAGHSDFEYDITVDLDTLAVAFLDSSIDENFDQDAFEIRLTSNQGNTVDWLIGAYTHNWVNFNENAAAYQPGLFGGLLSAAGPFGANVSVFTSSTFTQESDVVSLFGQATWNVSDTFRITAGVRYSDEEKKSAYTVPCGLINIDTGVFTPTPLPGTLGLCNSNPALPGIDFSQSDDHVLPEIAFQWDANDDVMFYIKAGEGAKAGGFTSGSRNPTAAWTPADQAYQPEEVFGYEVGMKSHWMNDRLEFNIAAYDTEFDDLQVNTFTPATDGTGVIIQRVTNAATASSSGVEMDLRFAASDNLLLGAALAFQDVGYDSFVNGTCSIESGLASPCDQSGRPLPLAADSSGNVYANFSVPMGSTLNFVADLSVSFSDGYFTDAALEPAGEQDGWTKVDARIGIETQDGQWSLAVIGRNLGDEKVLGASQTFFNQFLSPTVLGYLEPPRTITLQGRYSFGSE
jgi:outer membrane receptor protein involved in Fe transport